MLIALRRFALVPGALSLAFAVSCVPTLSKQRGEEHLNAWAEAEAHQHHGRLKEAAAAYEHAAESAERRVDRDEAKYRESRVYARMGDLAKATEICDELGAAEPMARRTLRARLDAARYRLLTNQEEQAEEELRRLITEHPDSAAARGALRMLATRHVDGAASKDDALVWVEGLLEEVRNQSIAEGLMSIQSELLLQLDRREEARAVLETQVEQYPYPQGRRWDDALYKLADLALEDGDPKAAMKAYQHVRDEFPRSLSVDDALEEEAMLRIENGQRDKGCDLLKEVLEKHETGSARRRAEAHISESCS